MTAYKYTLDELGINYEWQWYQTNEVADIAPVWLSLVKEAGCYRAKGAEGWAGSEKEPIDSHWTYNLTTFWANPTEQTIRPESWMLIQCLGLEFYTF